MELTLGGKVDEKHVHMLLYVINKDAQIPWRLEELIILYEN
jgi:hypothetical protein